MPTLIHRHLTNGKRDNLLRELHVCTGAIIKRKKCCYKTHNRKPQYLNATQADPILNRQLHSAHR